MLFWIVLSTLIVSFLGLIGVFTLFLKERIFKKTVFPLVAFSAGALLSAGLFHLLMEGLEEIETEKTIKIFLFGFLLFFFLEKFIDWHHCHEIKCKTHPFSYLLLLGDFIHNFIDGLTIAASFMTSFNLGLFVVLAIILHEIPQEMGNFAILVYAGFNKKKAMVLKFLAQASAIVGGLFGWFAFPKEYLIFLLPFAAGGFLYISASDLIPRIGQDTKRRNLMAIVFFLVGVVFLLFVKKFLG